MKLENWFVTLRTSGRTGESYSVLGGEVYGHPKWENGHYIYTSSVVSAEGECVCTASGSRYELGVPAPEYEKRFPNARKRLFAAFAVQSDKQR